VSAGDSLVFGDVVELLAGGVKSVHPLCPGVTMVLQPGFDRGAGVPNTQAVASLLLDGERITGRRTSNRTISLPIVIYAPDRASLNGARELLLDIADQPRFRLTWTPDPQGGTPLPLVFQCFRASEAKVIYDQDSEDELVGFVSLTFPALPFGLSAEFTTLPFPSPAVGWSSPPAPVRIDDLGAVSSSTDSGDWSQSSQAVDDSFSARWDSTGSSASPDYTHVLAAPVDITGLDRIVFNFGLGTRNYHDWHNGRVTFTLSLTDSTGGPGHTVDLGGHAWCTASNDPEHPFWQPVTFALPDSATFDFAHVAAWSLHAWRRVDWFGHLTLDSDAYLNGLTAEASAQAPIALVRGTTYRIGAPGGTARTLMAAQFQPPPPPVVTPQVISFSTPGAWSWFPPEGATISKALVQGASGIAGARTTAGPGGGAGAGAAVELVDYPCTPGQAIGGVIGAGGTRGGFPALANTYVAAQDGSNSYSLVTASFSPTAGDVLVIKAIVANAFSNFGSPSGGSLAWTSRVNNGPSARVRIWTATVGASPPSAMTVTLPFSGFPLPHSMVVERWISAKLAASPATVSASGSSSAPSAALVTAAPNSAVSWVNADAGAASSARAYRSSATEESYRFVSGWYTGYWATQQAAAAGSQTVGLTTPASQTWALAGIEIQSANTGGLTDGQATTFDGLAAVAAGGKSVPDNTATGGLGGTVADCTVPAGGTAFRGGNGATGTTTGGGGGASAGEAAAGGDASGVTGGTPPSLGAAGGNGGAAGGNNPGAAGTAPGGAPGGAFSTGSTALSGASTAGKVTITYLAPLGTMHTLLVHAPGYNAPNTFSPIIPAGAGLDAPDGREYPIPSPVEGLNARFYGTHTVIVFLSVIDSPAVSRTHTVTFKQYDYPGGPATTKTVSRVLTPSAEDPAILNGVVMIDALTLPCRDIADDQTAAYTTVGFTSTNANDRALDIAVVDVTGQFLLLNVSGAGYPNYWWDIPDADRDWGRILASTFDRPQAISILDSAILSGGPLMVDPDGPGWLVAYSPDAGAPSLTAGFWKAFRDSRLS
jgi:hypothetical protein